MSKYYNPGKSRNLFNPKSKNPFKLSRSKIDLFLNCARCFYFDRRHGIGQVPGFPFNLNSAVDTLLKREFDAHRVMARPHPLMEAYGIDAIPFDHERMDEWRESLTAGIQYVYEPANLLVTGGVDDVWVNSDGELIIVDYKATSKPTEVNLDADWQIGYKRQMETYQWLFRKNGFDVSPIGYFVYCNGDASKPAFNGKLEFRIKLIPYSGNTSWIEPTLHDMRACLESETIPLPNPECDFCKYRQALKKIEFD